MTDQVQIFNKALGWLGQSEISSFQDNNRKAELARNNYATIRDAVLESRWWTFATFRAKRESATPDEWENMFVYPIEGEWLKVFRVYKDIYLDKNVQSVGWRVEGKSILAEDAMIYISGVRRITDTTYFSPLFVECLAARIAADLAMPITQNRKLQADMWALYTAKLDEAAARDGGQGRSEIIDATRLTGARAR